MGKQITLTIDGKEIKANDGQSLIDVAKENDIYIPTLCHFENIYPPLGTCRVCSCKINGQVNAGCTARVREGMEVEVQTKELIDNRKAVIEMLFAEGNHYCPACEKSGDCDLQHHGYEMGISISRFPHLFKDKVMDFDPKRLVIEHNRCILCRRCEEEVLSDQGEKIFSFVERGNKTLVSIDYEKEATLSEEDAMRASHICPVGAILVRGKSLAKPFGVRKYDQSTTVEKIPLDFGDIEKSSSNGKKIVATASLAGCFGCHMSMLDIDTELLDLVEFVEFNKSPLTDIKTFSKQCDIGIIEGGCCNTENIEVLREFRKKCDILVALGECSIWGGLPAMRNTVPLQECLEEAYLHSMTSEPGETKIPYHEDIPKILDKVYACNEIVKIDHFIPGCPPSASHIWKAVKNILFGEQYSIAYTEFKYD